MPIHRYNRVARRRRCRRRAPAVYRRKRFVRRRGKVTRSVIRSPGMPEQLFVKLNYSQEVSTTVGTAVFLYHDFKINSLFDPDYTGVGHQPIGFDQYSAFFKKYRVYGMKYNIEFYADTSTEYTYIFLRTLDFDDVATALNDAAYMTELFHLRKFVLGTTGYRGIHSVNGFIPACKSLSMSPKEYNLNPNTYALISTNPAKQSLLRIYHRLVNGSGTSFTIRYKVHFTYYVKFFDRVRWGQS